MTEGTRRAGADRFAAAVRRLFGDRVRELTLFGSEARREATEDSDVDVAVVITALTSEEARRLDDVTGDILTELGVLVVPLCLSEQRAALLRSRERRLMVEIDQDGVPL